MQFNFTDDQLALGETVRRFLERYSSIAVVRGVVESEKDHDAELWKALGAQGYLGAAIPEEFGGIGAGYLELCKVAEECGRALTPVPMVASTYVAAEFLLLAGNPDQQAQWLPRLASGEAVGTLALSEIAGEATPESIGASFVNGRLSGTKLPVAHGASANFAIVVARDGESGLSTFIVDLAEVGVSKATLKSLDPSRKQAQITFVNVRAERVGAAGEGWELLERVRDRAAVLVAFEQVGGATRALETARDYALGRFAFGRPIGSFQAIKHVLANMYVATELARSNAYFGAWALAAASPQLAVAAAQARVSATAAYQQCASDNIQVHGGMGFTWEFDCHLHYRRSQGLALALGGPSLWEDRLIDRIGPLVA